MKRLNVVLSSAIVVMSSIIAVIGLSLTLGDTAWSAAESSSTAVIIFDDAAQQAQLIIPTPACPASQPNCEWKFFLNEPKLSVDVSTVYGTSGTLTLAYPRDFCGVIQADAYVGPPWVAKRGFQHTIQDCTPPTTTTTAPPTTTTTAPPATTTTTEPPTAPTTSTTTPTPPVFAATNDPPPAAPPAPPLAPPPAAAPESAPVSATQPQLPFTGRDMKPLLLIGLTLVAVGLSLLTTTESWRRMTRWLLATVLGH